MSEGKGVTKTYVSANTALDSTGDKLTVEAVKPFIIQRSGVIQDGGTDPGTSYTQAVDKRPTAGTDSDVNSRGAREELYTLSPSASVGQGNGVYADIGSREQIVPGEEAVVEVTAGGAAGATGHVFLEVVEYPFAGESELTNMVDET